MTQFQWRETIAFVNTLCSATLDKKGDALKESQMNSCKLMLKAYPFIPNDLYTNVDGVLEPTGKAIGYTQAMRKAPGNQIVQYRTYNDNAAFADYVLSSRMTTDDRWEVFGEMARLIHKYQDWPDYSEKFYIGLCEVGGAFVATGETSAYSKAVSPKKEVEENS